MDIFLVRHGETDWNLLEKMQGHQDIPLNKKGQQQAKELALKLREKQVDEIYSSTMKRALETADIISRVLGKPAYMTEGLIEKGYGEAEGLTMAEANVKFADVMAAWMEHPLNVKFPGEGSETDLEVLQRVYGTWEEILKRAKGNIVIVTHGATMSILLQYLFRETPEEIPEHFGNVSITTLRYSRLTEDLVLMGQEILSK